VVLWTERCGSGTRCKRGTYILQHKTVLKTVEVEVAHLEFDIGEEGVGEKRKQRAGPVGLSLRELKL
jgi:hypothetical protein